MNIVDVEEAITHAFDSNKRLVSIYCKQKRKNKKIVGYLVSVCLYEYFIGMCSHEVQAYPHELNELMIGLFKLVEDRLNSEEIYKIAASYKTQ